MNIYNIHKTNPGIFTQLTLKDQLFCYYECPQKDKVVELYSNHNQLTFTVNGSRIVRQGTKQWLLNEGHGFLLKRGAFHQEIPDDFSGWEVLVLYLKDDYLKTIFEEFRSHLPLKNLPEVSIEMIQPFNIDQRIKNCYEGLLPYFSSPHLLLDSIFEGKFKELLFNILIHPANTQVLAYVNQLVGDYTTPIWEVMEANYTYDLKVSEFAEISNRSTSTFRREFEDHYHTTPGKWLTTKRLEKAKLLLETSNKTISEITFNCGFKNVSHFSRIFKEKFKLSPTEYRSKKNKG